MPNYFWMGKQVTYYNQENSMKKVTVLLVFVAVAALSVTAAFADEYVNGYTRKDGTQVQSHYRSEPNSSRSDNYSSQGNTNPYTGERGSQRNENSDPPAYNQSYGRTRR